MLCHISKTFCCCCKAVLSSSGLVLLVYLSSKMAKTPKRPVFLQKRPSCFLAETKFGQTLVHFLNIHAFKSCIEFILLN